MTALRTRFTATLALLTALAPLTACTASGGQGTLRPTDSLGAVRLVAFDSCVSALESIRAAAKAAVGPYGFNSVGGREAGTADLAGPALPPAAGAKSDAIRSAVPDSTNSYSGTN